MEDGTVHEGEKALADAHPAGNRPFARAEYINKFRVLTEGIVAKEEQDRFLNLVQDLENLSADQLKELNVQLDPQSLTNSERDTRGIF